MNTSALTSDNSNAVSPDGAGYMTTGAAPVSDEAAQIHKPRVRLLQAREPGIRVDDETGEPWQDDGYCAEWMDDPPF